MLTYYQVDVIEMLSGAVWFGVIGGALSGALTSAVIRRIRTHRFVGLLPGLFCSALLAAGIAVSVSFIAVFLQMLLCKPGHKCGWDVPVWAEGVQAVFIFIAGAIGAFLADRPKQAPLKWHGIIGWTLVGAFLGTLAHLDNSFNGYYVLKSNARPIRDAITGFVVGGIVALSWRLMIGILQRGKDKSTTST